MAASYTVSIYMINRAIGGPEEGGWWYTYGEPCDELLQFLRVFKTKEQAQAYRNRLERKLVRKLNRGRRSIGSVLSEGEYCAIVDEGMPKRFPEQRPHYE